MNELKHHGIKGQRWGIRRYQNPDGTLTAAGKKKKLKYEFKQDKKNLQESAKTVLARNSMKQIADMLHVGAKRLNDSEKIRNTKSVARVNDAKFNISLDQHKKRVDAFVAKYGEKKLSDLQSFRLIGKNEIAEAQKLLNNRNGLFESKLK